MGGANKPSDDGHSSDIPCELCPNQTMEFLGQARARRKYLDFREEADLFHAHCSSCAEAEIQYPSNLCDFCRHLRLRHLICCTEALLECYFRVRKPLERDSNCQLCFLLTNIIYNYGNLLMGPPEPYVSVYDSQEDISFMVDSILAPVREQSVPDRRIFRWRLLARSRGIFSGILQPALSKIENRENCIKAFVDWNPVLEWHESARCEVNDTKLLSSPVLEGFNLIDISNLCVSGAPRHCKYVTLSYVWGSMSSRSQANSGNIKTLQQPGGLKFIDLPLTISDAINACTRLGYRYLWVDALCIIQDNAENKHYQISHMDRIYEGASLCLVAAAGMDANYGLPGVSRPRSWNSAGSRIHDIQISPLIDNVEDLITLSKWNRRAWTFQESWLSKRLMFFTDYGLVYHDRSPNSPYRVDHGNYYSTYGSDSFRESSASARGMLKAYTGRELSFEGDILKACSGVMHRVFPGGTTYGLPYEDFHSWIIWNTNDYVRPNRISSPENLFPSWSWASAFGVIAIDKNSCLTVACWASVTQDRSSGLRYMIPKSGMQHASSKFGKTLQSDNLVAAFGLAWSEGCLAKEAPPELQINCSAKEYERRLCAKWTTSEACWMGAFGSFLADSPFHDSCVETACSPGRLLVYTQFANLNIEAFTSSTSKPSGEQYLLIRSKDGSYIGQMRLGSHQKERLANKTSARFIALSMGLESHPDRVLGSAFCSNCKRLFMPSSLPDVTVNIECGCQIDQKSPANEEPLLPNPKGSSVVELIESDFDELPRRKYPPDIYFLDSEGEPVFASPLIPTMKVMLVHSTNEDDGDRIVQRLGIAEISLKNWIRAERTFETFVLE